MLKGELEITRSGMGFVTIESMETDILIRPGDFNTAMHGDKVLVAIKEHKSAGKRMQGIVKEVLVRKRTEFLGHLEMSKGFAFFIAEMDRPMPDIFIPLSNIGKATDKDKVVVRIVEWENNGKRPVGEVIQVLAAEEGNDAAMKEILLEQGFPLAFSDEALEVAARIPDIISKQEIQKRRDIRPLLTFTIDPADAKDFDDAISFRKMKNGNLEIGVHIADVSHYLQESTELDKEAYQRATSVYLPDRVNPMLPEHISNFLCSLRPKEDKLTFSVIFQVTVKGEVKEFWIGKTVMHSDHRFTYEDVQTIIEEGTGLYSTEVLTLNDIAQRLRKKRFQQGAINFSSQEVRFRLNEKGDPVGIMIKESLEAHQLVEEFMSRDGLLPKIFSRIHPRYGTPSFSTILTGLVVAIPALFLNLSDVLSLTSIGTLFAFVLVCGGVLVLQNQPDRPQSKFRVPYLNGQFIFPLLVLIGIGLILWKVPSHFTEDIWTKDTWPMAVFWVIVLIMTVLSFVNKLSLIPILGMISCFYLMAQETHRVWMRFLIWLVIGLFIYFLYSYHNSKLAKEESRG